jgi:hypothetical protein
MFPGTVCLPVGLFITGWTARANIHWIVPDIGIAFVGAGVILNFQSIQTYVIDAFTLHAASGKLYLNCLECAFECIPYNSTRRCDLFTVLRWLWLSTFRSCDV